LNENLERTIKIQWGQPKLKRWLHHR